MQFCTFAAMKKLLLLILFVLNLVLLQAQKVEFISVNNADTTLENIIFKKLPKLLEKDSLTADTLTTPAKWMLKLNKKLSKQQQADSNIYIFFCHNPQDSVTAFLPLSGKYGYVLFDTAKTGIVELDSLQLRVSTWKYQWDLIHDPENMLFAFMQDESEGALMANMPNFFGQKVTAPNGSRQGIHEDAVPIQDENDYTLAFITPDEKVFLWIDEGQWQGFFENGEKARTSGYLFYVEDKYMRESDPLSWGIYLAANDLGGFAIDMVESPGETTKNLATGIWKIATLQFDIEKTWERIISADRTDGAYVVATLALGYLAGPKCKKLVTAEEAPKFQEMLGEYASKARPAKLTWTEFLALFKKAREFERLVSKHLKTIFKAEEGFSVTSQVFVKVDGVMSIADDIIYNSKTNQFILNETKYGVTNALRRNQKVIEDAVKAGKQLEIRTAEDFIVNGKVIFSQSDKITISKIIRSHSVDGTITSNTVKTIWP